LDLIGFGDSDQPGIRQIGRLNNEIWSNQVKDFITQVIRPKNSGKVILIGNSLGSLVALTCAVSLEDQIAKVIASPLPDQIQENKKSKTKNLSFNIGNKKNLKFDSIFMNPPYFDKETVNESKSHYQSITKYHGGSNLDKWINNSLQLLKFKGTITMINKIENLNRIICLLSGLGSITILPLISNMNGEAQRFILGFRKGSNAKTRVLRQVVLHQESGAFSDRVEDTLRGRARIDLTQSDYFYQI